MNNDIAMQMGFVNETILSPRPRHCPPFGTALYENHSEQRFGYVESDLKFVLYMYGVKNMRDICGRITTALEIIKAKKYAKYNNICLFILNISNYFLIHYTFKKHLL